MSNQKSMNVTGSTPQLLALPQEVRTIIIEYLVVSNEPIETSIWFTYKDVLAYVKTGRKFMDLEPETTLALARTCTTFTAEVHAMYYRYNTFFFPDCDDLYKFLGSISAINRRHIRRVKFIWEGLNSKPAFEMLQRCISLEYIECELHPCSIVPQFELSMKLDKLYHHKVFEAIRVLRPEQFELVLVSAIDYFHNGAPGDSTHPFFTAGAVSKIHKRFYTAITSRTVHAGTISRRDEVPQLPMPGYRFSRRIRNKMIEDADQLENGCR